MAISGTGFFAASCVRCHRSHSCPCCNTVLRPNSKCPPVTRHRANTIHGCCCAVQRCLYASENTSHFFGFTYCVQILCTDLLSRTLREGIVCKNHLPYHRLHRAFINNVHTCENCHHTSKVEYAQRLAVEHAPTKCNNGNNIRY